MSFDDFRCPICGEIADSTEKIKRIGTSQQKIYLCQNLECKTRVIQEYDKKNNAYSNELYLDDTDRMESEIWQQYKYKRLNIEQWNKIREREQLPGFEKTVELKADKCEVCGTPKEKLRGLVELKGQAHCPTCAEIYINEAIRKIPITTTLNIDGYRISEYIDIESIEVVIGTGVFSEIGGGISDFFGARSSAFETKLQGAKQTAFKTLKYRALEKGGDAIVGIDIDYTEFSGNRIGLIVNGTVVKLVPEN